MFRTWAVAVVLALLATSNLYVPDLGGGVLADPTTITLGAAALLAAYVWAVHERFRLDMRHAVLGVVAVSFLPGLVMAADHSYGRFKLLGILAAFATMGAVLQLLRSERTRAAFLVALGASGAVVAAAVLVFGEYAGMNPISLGRMAALGLVLAYMLWARGGRRGVALAAVAGVVTVVAAVSTGARGPLVAAVLAVGVAFLPGRRFSRVARWGVAAAAVVAAVGVGFVLSTASTGRDYLWARSLELAVQHPLGIGFGDLYGKFPLRWWQVSESSTLYSHNVLIEAAVEGGWLALAGLLLALVVSFRCLYRDATSLTGRAMLAVWVFAVVNASLSSDLVGNRLMWVMVGAGLALLASRDRAVDGQVAEDGALAVADLDLAGDRSQRGR
jgi:hypothetical protein